MDVNWCEKGKEQQEACAESRIVDKVKRVSRHVVGMREDRSAKGLLGVSWDLTLWLTKLKMEG